MNRRRLLALAGVGVGVPGGYLAWNWYRSPELPDGMDVDTLHTLDAPTFVLGEEWENELDTREERHHVFADADTADESIRTTNASVASFVDDTDFEESYLLVAQNGMQSNPEPELRAIERREDGIHVEITIDSSIFGGPDDHVIHTLLFRITDTKADVPENVSVDIEGYP